MGRGILQRYVLRELVSPTLLGLIVFTFVLLATHLFRLMDLLVSRGVPFPVLVQFVWTLLPPLLILTTPMALLVGVLLGVGRLAADNEVTAMRTSGVHLLRVFMPVLVAAALLGGGLWIANRSLVPVLVNLNRHLLDVIKFIVTTRLEAGRVFSPETERDRDVALYFHRRNPLTQRMEGIALKVILKDPKKNERTQILVTAREGRIEPDPMAGLIDVLLTSGTLHYFDSPTTASRIRCPVAQFEEMRWRMPLVEEKKRLKPGQLASKRREMTNREIAQALTGGSLNRSDTGALSAELGQRRSIPLACLAFALLGVPLAIRVRPTGRAVAFSIAFGLIFFYYIMLKWGVSLSQNGWTLGVFVIFLPNILVGGVGFSLFYRTLRQ